MSYIALYRKWRPLKFSDVVEQEHVVKTLKHSVSTQRIAHAYLFCGTRGTGKTTMAHILSRAINCLNPKDGDPCNECEICRGILSGSILDVLEIDAASNNSVDNVRDIRDEVVYTPSRARYKVYIIDEVHMLSSGAFNALLKTLEEPPAHVVFILATTEPHKLPATILSRCQRFDFRRITVDSIIERLQQIAGASGVKLKQEAARLIARMADGAMRDAISLLDQCISTGGDNIDYDTVLSVIGLVTDTFISETVDCIIKKDVGKLLGMVEKLVMDGKDITQFVSDLVLYYRNLMICKVSSSPEEIIEASDEAVEIMKKQAEALSLDQLTAIIKELSSQEAALKWTAHPRVLLEVSLIRLCEDAFHHTHINFEERLAALERRLESGTFVTGAASAPIRNKEEHSQAKVILSEGISAEESPKKQSPQNAAEKPAAKPAGKDLPIWEAVLNDLKNSGKMVLYSNLFGTRAVELNDKLIGIIFGSGSGFRKMLVSRAENLDTVQSVVAKHLGKDVRIKCLDEGNLTEAAEDSSKEPCDELVEKAKSLAEKLNAPLNIIEE